MIPQQMQMKNSNPPDTAETIHISSLALLKMIKHGMFSLLYIKI